MEHRETDIFESTKSNPFHNENKDTNNFFLNDEATVTIKPQRIRQEKSKRLNDYDFNLLKEDAYKDISDDLFKLEYKISKTEEEIEYLNAQIQAANDIRDFNLVQTLTERKKEVIDDREALLAIYNDKSLSAKITDNILNILGVNLKDKIKNLNSKWADFTDNIISRMPKRFSSILEIKKSLTKLENINKSVDELITLNIPYGENIDKYQQLSKYIIKANSIQSQIASHLRGN